MISRDVTKNRAGAERTRTRFTFVSGKGGVGKTTVAAAIALRLAKDGKRTLLVSTDIGRSLDDVFSQEIGFEETPIAGRQGLFAVNVDPVRSVRKSRERIIQVLEALDPDSVVLSQMKLDEGTACGAAQAAVFEMNHYLSSSEYDEIVFDTAPTGIHLEKILSQSNTALSLAKQVAARKEEVRASGQIGGDAALDALALLLEQDQASLKALASDRTSFYLVMLPEAMPLAEVERSMPMLEGSFGIHVRGIFVNEVIPGAERASSAFWEARGKMQDEYVEKTRHLFPDKEIHVAYLAPEMDGVDRVERMADGIFSKSPGLESRTEADELLLHVRPEAGKKSFVFFSGKGGVGKTTISAATAIHLAREGHRTLLVSTDLQRSLDDVFRQRFEETPTPVAGKENLFAVTLDPVSSLGKYRGKLLETLELIDPESVMIKQMRAEASVDCGCAQAALFELGEYLNSKDFDVVVFDTAPLGAHLEKLAAQNSQVLSLAKSYEMQKDLAAGLNNAALSERVEALAKIKERDEASIAILRSEVTKYVLIMIAEKLPFKEIERTTKVLEAEHRIAVRGVVVNQVIPESERERSDFWRERSKMQQVYVDLARKAFRPRPVLTVPLTREESLGTETLENVARAMYRETSTAEVER